MVSASQPLDQPLDHPTDGRVRDWPFVHALLIALIFVLFTVDYAAERYAWIPRLATWIPELISAAITPFVVARMAFGGLQVTPKYLIWGLVMIFLLIISAVIHEVQPGAVFYGMRKYLRYVPIFLVPILFPEIRERFGTYLWLILGWALAQIPVSIYQWLYLRIGDSGDAVEGTVTTSGVLTVFLTCCIAIVTAFYVKKRLGFVSYVILAALLTIPTLLNESTATILLLPVALAVPFLLSGTLDPKKLVSVSVVLGLLMSTFVIAYSMQYSDRWGSEGLKGAIDGGLVNFLYRGADEDSQDYGEQMEIGRIDAVLLPLMITDDPVRWMVGVGPGNASSTFNRTFEGEFSRQAEGYGVDFTTASSIVWELGLVGLLMSFGFLYMLFRDAMKSAKTLDGWQAGFCLGWVGVSVLIVMSFFYHNLIDHTVFSYLMWLFAGQVVALRVKNLAIQHSRIRPSSESRPSRAAVPSTASAP